MIIFSPNVKSVHKQDSLKHTVNYLLSAAERRGTPVLLSASVSDNFGNSPQMSAPRRSCEIDQSTQPFHVSCDNRCGYANHGILLMDDTLNFNLLMWAK